jgi:hypothetical protein
MEAVGSIADEDIHEVRRRDVELRELDLRRATVASRWAPRNGDEIL